MPSLGIKLATYSCNYADIHCFIINIHCRSDHSLKMLLAWDSKNKREILFMTKV